jgi:hypothetical protein
MQTLDTINALLLRVGFPGYEFAAFGESGRMYLQAEFMAPDCKTGEPKIQYTRKWYLSREATDSEIVQTAFKCVLTSLEHEAREAFRYRGQAIFGPHFDVEKLVALCAGGDFESLRTAA